MTREHLILCGFIFLVVAVFVFVVVKGIHSKQRLCAGIFAMIVLSVLAIGLHFLKSDGASFLDFTTASLSVSDIGLGVLLIALACIGCMCADQRG